MHCGASLMLKLLVDNKIVLCENYNTTCATVDTHAYSSLWMVYHTNI